MKKLFLAILVGGILATTIGAYAASLGGNCLRRGPGVDR